MIAYLGNEEVVLVQVPRGTHRIALEHDLDLQGLALAAVLDRIRAASLASHMSRSIQMKFYQKTLNAE
jgi:hypothetical protein